jgi:dTDP-4-dehydrorhamnose reductase
VRLLVTGAEGMLGWEIQRVARRMAAGVDWRVAAHTRDSLDVTDPEAVRQAIGIISPGVLINCAAYTDVDGCESNEIEALRVNGEAPGRLARICEETGVVLVHFSTDTSDGRLASLPKTPRPARSPPRTISSRAGGDPGGGPALIIRTQWLYGSHGKNFIDTILLRAAAGEPLRVVNDQHGAPTYARELAAATLAAIAKGLRGTYHAANSGACTWYDVARAALALADMDPEAVTPVPTAEVPRPARRPPGACRTRPGWSARGCVSPLAEACHLPPPGPGGGRALISRGQFVRRAG